MREINWGVMLMAFLITFALDLIVVVVYGMCVTIFEFIILMLLLYHLECDRRNTKTMLVGYLSIYKGLIKTGAIDISENE